MLDKKIKYFLTVVEEGSFSAAARKLLLSQSALSQQVTILESELSVKLFDREGYRPSLTHSGKRYYKVCRDLQVQYREMVEDLTVLEKNFITIGFTGSSENRELRTLIREFQNEYPDVTFSFLEGNFEEVFNNLRNHDVDIAFGLESEASGYSDISYYQLYEYEICIICACSHPLAARDEIDVSEVKNEDLIVLSRNFGRRTYAQFMQSLDADGMDSHIKKTVDTFDELMFNVVIGEGIAIVGGNVVGDSDVKAVKLNHTNHKSAYVVGYRKDQINPVHEKFIKKSRKFFS